MTKLHPKAQWEPAEGTDAEEKAKVKDTAMKFQEYGTFTFPRVSGESRTSDQDQDQDQEQDQNQNQDQDRHVDENRVEKFSLSQQDTTFLSQYDPFEIESDNAALS